MVKDEVHYAEFKAACSGMRSEENLKILLVRGDSGFLLIRKITPCPNALGV